MCVCVCVYVCERERGRGREIVYTDKDSLKCSKLHQERKD